MQINSNQEGKPCRIRLCDTGNFTKANWTSYYERKLTSFQIILQFTLLKPNTVNNLGCSDDRKMIRDTLCDKDDVESSDESLKDMIKLFQNSTHFKSHPFVSTSHWNDHWDALKKKRFIYLLFALQALHSTRF